MDDFSGITGISGSSLPSWVSDHADVINNIAKAIEPLEQLITGAAYLIGLSFAFKAIYSMKVYGEARTMMSSNTSLKEPLTYLIAAGMFIYLPTSLAVFMKSTFGYANVLQYAPISSNNNTLNSLFGPNSAVGSSLTKIIQFIGLVAFMRGWVLVARSASQGSQPGGTGKGLMHVFGGILAINIVGTMQIINNTLYGS